MPASCVRSPETTRRALERDLPMVKCTGPVMVEQVRRSVSRCTVPSCSMPTSGPTCSTVFPSNHLGGRTEGIEVSHSNQAGAGSITVTSRRPRTMVMDCSVGEGQVTTQSHRRTAGRSSPRFCVPFCE